MQTQLLTIPNTIVSTPPSPELATTRIPLIDILRGYALLGIFLVRMVEVYSGWTIENTLSTAHTDLPLHQLVAFIAIGKFRALFSLLFGLSFYLQLQKFEQKGLSFTSSFLKRLGVLFLFGLLHSYLLWSGDILRWYAFAGLLLLPLYKLPTKPLFFIGLFLVIIPTIGEDLFHRFSSVVTSANPEEVAAVQTLTSTTSYWTMLKANFIIVNAEWFHLVANISHVLTIAGYFLLGVWAGRLELFMPGKWKQQYLDHKQELVKLAVVVILVTSVIGIVAIGSMAYSGIPVKSLFTQNGIGRLIIFHSKTPVLVLIHIVGLFLLLRVPFLQKRLTILSYAGRMTLTNYILQSMIGIGIFYGIGLGLYGKIGPTYCIPLTLALFIVQVWASQLYLKRFKSGPLEYIWRVMVK